MTREWISVPGGRNSAAAERRSGSRTSSHPEHTLTGLTESKIRSYESKLQGSSRSTTLRGQREMYLSEGFVELFWHEMEYTGAWLNIGVMWRQGAQRGYSLKRANMGDLLILHIIGLNIFLLYLRMWPNICQMFTIIELHCIPGTLNNNITILINTNECYFLPML